jgi:hypothetical protein
MFEYLNLGLNIINLVNYKNFTNFKHKNFIIERKNNFIENAFLLIYITILVILHKSDKNSSTIYITRMVKKKNEIY